MEAPPFRFPPINWWWGIRLMVSMWRSQANWFARRADPHRPRTRELREFSGGHSTFTSTRVTEGFADSFAPKSDTAKLDRRYGDAHLVQYSGFPAGASLFVPTVVAGSDATQPTAGGDLGLNSFRGQVHARRHFVVAAVFCPDTRSPMARAEPRPICPAFPARVR